MSILVDIITTEDSQKRDKSLDVACKDLTLEQLLEECNALDRFWRNNDNLYEKVRALFFLYAINRFHIPKAKNLQSYGHIPFEGYDNLLKRRFQEAIEIFLKSQSKNGVSLGLSSALAQSYQSLAFQILADQVRRSVKSVRGNQWMFRIGHPDDHPLRVTPLLLKKSPKNNLFPILHEKTPVRMDLTHSGWSDIFFLGMDFPEGARVLNISIDLSVLDENKKNEPKPPVEAFFRVIDKPILKLTSIDLASSVEINRIDEIFDFAKDYLGLLKAAVIASGLILPGMEGAQQPLAELLERLVNKGRGIELVSKVNDIPRGSRLAVSTTLLASLIAVCMRATGQTAHLTGPLSEDDRRLIASRAILGEWLGGSGGGWQDSGGLWPGMKTITGVIAQNGDPEFGISKGCLLPRHNILDKEIVPQQVRDKLHDSLVLVHGGMAQDVGPILEMVTEKYLLRSEREWEGRKLAIKTFDEIVNLLGSGDVQGIGKATQNNFNIPIQTIIPLATNLYTETIIQRVNGKFGRDFWGFWMLGGMSGGGMGFIFDPSKKIEGQKYLKEVMSETKEQLKAALPFAMDPVVYEFSINESGSVADLLVDQNALLPVGYYSITLPDALTKKDQFTNIQRNELALLGYTSKINQDYSDIVQLLFDRILPSSDMAINESATLENLLKSYGFDREAHEQIRSDLQNGRIGLAQNRLPINTTVVDVDKGDVVNFSLEYSEKHHEIGLDSLNRGEVGVISLAGGSGSRWTKGAGVVKGINPFCKLSGIHRTFIEIHLAKSRKSNNMAGMPVPHIITTSYMTHSPIKEFLERVNNYNYNGPIYLSEGKSVGLRLIPTERDLRFFWEEMPHQILDVQAQKVKESLHLALINWAKESGEGSDYRDNIPLQCLHPTGHWYELPNILKNGTLKKLLDDRPQLKYLMMHNIDTLGANLNPSILGNHIDSNSTFSVEVISRNIEDRGGGLARVDGKLRLVEGLAFPREELEFGLSYYNSSTFWISVDKLLCVFNLNRSDLDNEALVSAAIRSLASRMPTYITLKDVKKRWGKGQEDILPVVQFEKIWGDMTSLQEIKCNYIEVSRYRGQQLKEPGQLDGWLRDGSAYYVENLCKWGE